MVKAFQAFAASPHVSGMRPLAHLQLNLGIFASGFSFNTQIVGNVLTHNGIAIQLSGSDFQVLGNTLVANRGPGIFINGGQPTNFVRVTDNTLVGNRGAGLYLIGATSDMIVRSNNIYGNASAPSSQVPGIDALNCGTTVKPFATAPFAFRP